MVQSSVIKQTNYLDMAYYLNYHSRLCIYVSLIWFL